MTPQALYDLARRAGIKADSPQHTAVELKYLQHLSDYEIASRTGLSRGAVRYAIQRVESARAGNVTPTTVPQSRMSFERFHALAELAGIPDTTRTYAALQIRYVDGLSQAAAARAAGVAVSTVNNGMRKIENAQLRLPSLVATVRAAGGDV